MTINRKAAYKCARCEIVFEYEGPGEPLECSKDFGGCGSPKNRTRFEARELSRITIRGVNWTQVLRSDGYLGFAALIDDKVQFAHNLKDENGIPINPVLDDTLLEEGVILPPMPEPYVNDKDLLEEIRVFIHEYLDVPSDIEKILSLYVPMTWLADKLTTVCYLRFIGDLGTGKSRGMTVIGSLCFNAIKTSGASSGAPVFRLLKRWGTSTMLIDEADWSASGEKADLTKILNTGIEAGTPVLKCDPNNPNNVQTFPTFGPKIIGSRQSFADTALESRCISVVLLPTIRSDIIRTLDTSFRERAKALRAKLLTFRLKSLSQVNPDLIARTDLGPIEPRLAQVMSCFVPILGTEGVALEEFKAFLLDYNRKLVLERGSSTDGLIVRTLHDLKAWLMAPTVKEIHANLEEEMSKKDAPTPQTISRRLRPLGLTTRLERDGPLVRRNIKVTLEDMVRLARRYIPFDDWDEDLKAKVCNACIACNDTVGGPPNQHLSLCNIRETPETGGGPSPLLQSLQPLQGPEDLTKEDLEARILHDRAQNDPDDREGA